MDKIISTVFSLGIGMLLSAAVHASVPEDLERDARQYYEQGDYSAAIIQLKNLLQQEPRDPEARILLARVYLDSGDAVSAEKELETALELGADENDLLPLLGKAWLQTGATEKVLQRIDPDRADTDGRRAELYYLHGQASLMRRDFSIAEADFSEALALVPDHADTLLGQARLMFAQGNLEGAEERIQRSLQSRPDNPDTWVLAGELSRIQGDDEAALERFQRALEIRNHHVGALLGRATVHTMRGDMDSAEQDLQLLRTLSPHHPVANYLRGVVQYRKGRLKEAAATLEETIAVLPDHHQSQLLLGTIYYQQGQYHQSGHYFEAYLKKFPGNITAVKLHAAGLIRSRQVDAAIAELERAIPRARDDAQLMAMLGTAYLNRSENDKALEYLQRAAELAPDVAAIQAQLALGHLLAGDGHKAAEDLQQAVDLGQDLIQADIMLVMTYVGTGDFDKAEAAARALMEKQPDNPVPHNLLGIVFRQQGRAESARDSFETALKINPEFYPARIQLAALDAGEGDLKAARTQYAEILAADGDNLEAMLGMAKLAKSAQDDKMVVEWLVKAREHHPGSLRAGMLLADQYLGTGEGLKALDVARELSETMPDEPEVLRLLGMAQIATGSRPAAVTTFTRLAELLPNNLDALYLLANAAQGNKDTKLAKSTYEEIISRQDDHAAALFGLGSIHVAEQEYDKALGLAEKLIDAHGDQAWGYVLASDALIGKGDMPGAVRQFEQAYSRDPSQAYMLRLHNLLKRAGNDKRAADVLDDWLEKHPDDGDILLVAAIHYQRMGSMPDAIAHYEQVLKVKPGNMIALNNLAWLYLETAPAKALQYAEQAYQTSPDKAEVLDTYGWALVKGGKVGNGLPYLQEALLKAPHLAEVRYHVAYALHQAGRDEEARRELDRISRMDRKFAESREFRDLNEKLK